MTPQSFGSPSLTTHDEPPFLTHTHTRMQQEYESYYHVKFKKNPRITKRLANSGEYSLVLREEEGGGGQSRSERGGG